MRQFAIAGIGEVLFDIVGDTEILGGAPVNFAFHAKQLGGAGYAISTIGQDERGKRILAEMERRQLSTEFISILDGYDTGFVEAQLDSRGVATYLFPADIAWDHLHVNARAMQMAANLDAICFGTLAQRTRASRSAITKFLEATSDQCLKVFDVNLRQQFYSAEILRDSCMLADVVKVNDEELQIMAPLFHLKGSVKEQLARLVTLFGLRLAVLTRGERGSLLVSSEQSSDYEGMPLDELADTIGAGDAFTAATVFGLLQGFALDRINVEANRLAAWVCSKPGAMPLMS